MLVSRWRGRLALWLTLVASTVPLVSVRPSAAAATATTDPFLAQQWALTQIGATAAWSKTKGEGIRIGIVDTGVDLSHEDLAGRVVASTNCVRPPGAVERCSGDGQDVHGHGTHVSAIAAAAVGNGKGIAGVAPDAQLVVARALSNDGRGGAVGTIADIDAGIRWVVDHGAQVVNLSLGTEVAGASSGLAVLSDGIEYAWTHGAIPVVAAGNEPVDGAGGIGVGRPVDYGGLNAVVVGASDENGRLASYSSSLERAKWGLIAPGGSGIAADADAIGRNIVSAWWDPESSNRYALAAGTSMAAPHVAGAPGSAAG